MFGSLDGSEAPDWREQEAQAALALQLKDKAERDRQARTWGDTARDVLNAPYRIAKGLVMPGAEDVVPQQPSGPAFGPLNPMDEVASMPRSNPVSRLGAGLGEAIASGVTAPGEALTGKLPAYDAEGHTSPEMIRRGFDLAALAGGASVAGTAEKLPALAADSGKVAAPIAAAEHARPFSTSIEPALASTARNAGTGAQWANELKRYGAKPEELDWRGVNDLLKSRETQPITRDEIAGHLDQNKIELTPVVRAEREWKDLTPDQQWQVKDAWTPQRHEYSTPEEFYNERLKSGEQSVVGGLDNPKFAEYQLPGGTNYRERLMTLPNSKLAEMTGRWKAGELTPAEIEQTQAMNAGQYKGNHWDEPNVVFHRRSTDRVIGDGEGYVVTNLNSGNKSRQFATREEAEAFQSTLPPKIYSTVETEPRNGVRSLHDEEVQSDWHQKGREKGYGETGGVPNAPFKDSWERLAAYDHLREAAEKGYDRISWTGGRAQTTNPKNFATAGRDLTDAQREQMAKADKGLRDAYDRRRPDIFNKIGKSHGVSVKQVTIPHEGPLSGREALDIMGRPVEDWQKLDQAGRNQLMADARAKGLQLHYMDVPQSLKDQALKKGFSLFEDTGAAAKPIAALEHIDHPAHNPVLQEAYHAEMGPEAGTAAYKAYLVAHGESPNVQGANAGRPKVTDAEGGAIQGAAYTKEARRILDDIAGGQKGAGPMDLSTQSRIPDVPQQGLPRYDPPRGISDRMKDALDNPDVIKGLADSIEKGKGTANWYHTEPVRQAFVKELGPVKGDAEFKRFMDVVAATSPRSDVPTNIRNASYYYSKGSPENLPDKNPYPYGHVAQNLHRQNFETVSSEGGWNPLQNPKPASFAENLRGNLEPATIDTHAFRNIAMRTGDPRFLETTFTQKIEKGRNPGEDSLVRKYGTVKGDIVTFRPAQLYKDGKITMEEAQKIPSFWASKPNKNEYAAAEQLFKNVGAKKGLKPADAQAAAWAGGGEMTGLGTISTHTFPELMNERILFTARMRGENPKKTLADFIRGKKPLLSDTKHGTAFGALDGGRDGDQSQ